MTNRNLYELKSTQAYVQHFHSLCFKVFIMLYKILAKNEAYAVVDMTVIQDKYSIYFIKKSFTQRR